MTNTQKIILYDAANSPCGRRVRMTLLEKGQEFEIRWLNLALMDQKQDWYLELNPGGMVPTLLHDGMTIFDSNVINEYLNQVYPEPALIPPGADIQAEIRMWMAFEMEWAKPFRDAIYQTYGKSRLKGTGITKHELQIEISKRTSNIVYQDIAADILEAEPDENVLQRSLGILMERMAWMNNELSDGRTWLVGDSFSLADITLAPRLAMFNFIGINDLYQRFPHIGKFMSRIAQRKSWDASNLLPDQGMESTFVGVQYK